MDAVRSMKYSLKSNFILLKGYQLVETLYFEGSLHALKKIVFLWTDFIII